MMWKMDSRTQELIRGEVTKEMIDILAAKAARIIQCKRTSENDRRVSGSSESSISSSPLSSSATIDDSEYYQSENKLISLRSFITNLVIKSKVHAGTLICTVEYLDRLKRKLPSGARGEYLLLIISVYINVISSFLRVGTNKVYKMRLRDAKKNENLVKIHCRYRVYMS
ncbi:hypothetical protein AX774_g6282 [Zancudomyces culisetae]|uniref:Uncharacterized protein n=1 Tax=Zancudomyces culisetae TaxID=1213189 RepID=A0A1R1PH29_ZANCU|nr:hypothetical protein AX774_g6282 [Zancudomyces culisetae]|eukprot:OMH80281.1 hypothetical protein AX774_g6282 [Zancudomyces culisetae]